MGLASLLDVVSIRMLTNIIRRCGSGSRVDRLRYGGNTMRHVDWQSGAVRGEWVGTAFERFLRSSKMSLIEHA